MRTPLALVTAAAVALVSVGCGPSAAPPTAPPVVAPTEADGGGTVLPAGKTDLPLAAGRYRSPAGFQPGLAWTLPSGWRSVHRGTDAFDLGQPDPARDAPLVAIVVLTPPEPTATATLAAVRARATGTVTPVSGRLGGGSADGLDVADGTGPLIASSAGGIALDAAPGQRARVLAADLAGRAVVCVVLVPDGRQWDSVWPPVSTILDSLTAG